MHTVSSCAVAVPRQEGSRSAARVLGDRERRRDRPAHLHAARRDSAIPPQRFTRAAVPSQNVQERPQVLSTAVASCRLACEKRRAQPKSVGALPLALQCVALQRGRSKAPSESVSRACTLETIKHSASTVLRPVNEASSKKESDEHEESDYYE